MGSLHSFTVRRYDMLPPRINFFPVGFFFVVVVHHQLFSFLQLRNMTLQTEDGSIAKYVDWNDEKLMKPLHLIKSYNKDLHFAETSSTAVAFQNFFYMKSKVRHCHLRHSLFISQDIAISDIPWRVKIVVFTVSFPGGHAYIYKSDWCYLCEDFASYFWIKQIIKLWYFQGFGFLRISLERIKKIPCAHYIQFGSSLCGPSLLSYCFQYDSWASKNKPTTLQDVLGCSWLWPLICCFLWLLQSVFSDLNPALTGGYDLPYLDDCQYL